MTQAQAAEQTEVLVYLVDDETQDLEIATEALLACRSPNRVKTFRNGQQLVDALSSQLNSTEPPVYPDLILLDLQMPVMSGLEALRWIRQQNPLKHITVIIFTSTSDTESFSQAFQLGCNGFLDKKQVDIDLTESLDSLEQYWISKPMGSRNETVNTQN